MTTNSARRSVRGRIALILLIAVLGHSVFMISGVSAEHHYESSRDDRHVVAESQDAPSQEGDCFTTAPAVQSTRMDVKGAVEGILSIDRQLAVRPTLQESPTFPTHSPGTLRALLQVYRV